MDRKPGRATPLLLVGIALLLVGCGAAAPETSLPSKLGVATSSAPEALTITTVSLPTAQMGGDYEPTQLAATGSDAPVRWALEDGDLPPGITLTAGGILSGQADAEGLFTFGVSATDGEDVDIRQLALSVGTFAVTIDGYAADDEAWGGDPLTLRAIGAEGDVSFDVSSTHSGGAFDYLDGDAGIAIWIPGDPDVACCDVLRATDVKTGAVTEIRLEVCPHPAPNHLAEFGYTDVWYVSPDFRTEGSTHGLPRDWDHALRMVGLRSSDPVPSSTDRDADFLVRRAMLCALNELFERNADGTRGAGFAISFPLDRPDAPYGTPAAGDWAGAVPNAYSTISLVSGPNRTYLGRAWQDDATNSLVENNSSSGGAAMGAFVDNIARTYNAFFQNVTLPESPIGAGDAATLRNLVHGRPVEGHRAMLIQWVVEGFGRSVAVVLAHEIGHSVGLTHIATDDVASIMESSTYHFPGAEHHFLPQCRAHLHAVLPGPGRAGSLQIQAAHMPIGGMVACTAE